MTNDPRPGSARPASPAPNVPRLAAATAILLAFAAACSPGAPAATPATTPGPTTGPMPTATPALGAIQHPTGATDVILRMETSGGFAPVEFMATSAPEFTLYGDGTVVWRDPTSEPLEPVGNVNRLNPFLTVRLSEDGIQALLADAIGRGALGAALGPYIGMGADIPTTTFTITADGQTKAVSVTGLSPDMHPQAAVIVAALSQLAERLQGFAGTVSGEAPYPPATYRGVMTAIEQPFGPVVAWPWSAIEPTDFAADANGFFLTRTLTRADIGELGVPGVDGGFSGLTLQSEGKLYSFALRPLLPDEAR
jgi:hypothetical protein